MFLKSNCTQKETIQVFIIHCTLSTLAFLLDIVETKLSISNATVLEWLVIIIELMNHKNAAFKNK